MGIPSYFSYIIKNYPKIIKNLAYFFTESPIGIQHLYMDCNSIIYDAVRSNIEYDNFVEFEQKVIEKVIQNIENYIKLIRPTKSVYIAFDGVAPFAKMNQQRTRRHKTSYLASILPPLKETWNTSAITPGTDFMNKLSKSVDMHFQYHSFEFSLNTILVSGSNDPGEGEHKLFENIRKSDFENDQIAVYGLDADLFMLSIFHLNYCKNIYVFREAPEFLKNSIPIGPYEDANSPFFIDVTMLAMSISNEMACKFPHQQRIFDYVFLCFFLGNDFLPHFPAMNIRTHGIQAILDIYRAHIGNIPNRFLISNQTGEIQWKYVGILINEISKREHQLLSNEYFVRNKFNKRQYPENTPKEKEEFIDNIPVMLRSVENYICPDEEGWEKRYYKSLFKLKRSHEEIKPICVNYLEGLEWVFKYYTEGCPDWRWKYNYHYPPLFVDLAKYIPHLETEFISKTANKKPFNPYLQLAFVLPRQNLHLLPLKIKDFLLQNYGEFYPEKYTFEWAFCRYFWESHPVLPEMSLNLLEQLDIQFKFANSKSLQ